MKDPLAQTFSVPGRELLRVLSDRERSKVFLARSDDGQMLAVKLELPQTPNNRPAVLNRYKRLQDISAAEGFVRILDFGELPSGWVWHSVPLADNLPGLEPITSELGWLHYTPLTLAALILENSPTSAVQVARWGQRICHALGVLHQASLVHRDVKPTNLVFIQGELCLADYGLVGEPGSEYDFSGTEGFVPIEGTADSAADLFALGKTLYQAWTGKDRLEFPSLPAVTSEGPDWVMCGRRLNEVILRACHAQPSRRFRSAEQFSQALAEVLTGQGKLSRRKWLAIGSVSTASAATWIFCRSRPVAMAVWRRLRPAFNLESWQGPNLAHWGKGRLYSVCCELTGCWFHSVDLETFAVKTRALHGLPQASFISLLHPASGKVWAVEGGLGDVYEIDPETGTVEGLGGGPCERKNAGAALYWNPVTGRLGTFGGYGYFAVNNSRHEYDPATRTWLPMINLPTSNIPWPRLSGRSFFPPAEPLAEQPIRIFLEGGNGSPSGKQGVRTENLRGFNGQFHNLDDIWALDLKNNRWTEVLRNGLFPMPPQALGERMAFYHPLLQGIVAIVPAILDGLPPRKVSSWLVRPGLDRKPIQLAQEGEVSQLGSAWAYTCDPRNHELLMFGHDGVYRIAFH